MTPFARASQVGAGARFPYPPPLQGVARLDRANPTVPVPYEWRALLDRRLPLFFYASLAITAKQLRRQREALPYGQELAPFVLVGTMAMQPPPADDDFGSREDVRRTVAQAAQQQGGADRVRFVAEVREEYALEVDGDLCEHEIDSLLDGADTLADAFAAGNPLVREQLGIYAVHPRSRATCFVAAPFRYLPSEGWSWSDPALYPDPTAQQRDVMPLEQELSLQRLVDALG